MCRLFEFRHLKQLEMYIRSFVRNDVFVEFFDSGEYGKVTEIKIAVPFKIKFIIYRLPK